MPILQNTDQTTQGVTDKQYSWWPAGSGPVPEPNSRTKVYREGTGRRRKPVVPDETDYVFHSIKTIAPTGSGEYHTPWNDRETFQGVLPYFMSSTFSQGLQEPLSTDPNLANAALVDALSSLNRRDLDFGTAWKERGKTAQLIGDIASKTVNTIHAARNRQGRRILSIWGLNHDKARGKGVVDAYLAYHYGVKPLLQDVSGAVQALVRVPMNDWRVTCKAKKGYRTFKSTKVGSDNFHPYLSNSDLTQSCKVSITATQRPLTREQDLAWSLGLDNPLATAWELTPFSFVADWMFPIGDWLSALNSRKYYTDWKVVSSRFRKEVCWYLGSTFDASYVSASTSVFGGFHESIDVERSIAAGPPLPWIPFKDPRSLDHMAKSLALLVSVLAGGGDLPRNVRY